jgi:hypothetical protein
MATDGRLAELSRFKGVSWDSCRAKWRACIRIEKTVHLGYFEIEEEAAPVMYDYAGKARFGVMANSNFPLQE